MPAIFSKPINTDIICDIMSNEEIIKYIKELKKDIIVEDLSEEIESCNQIKFLKKLLNIIESSRKNNENVIILRHYNIMKYYDEVLEEENKIKSEENDLLIMYKNGIHNL